MENALASLCADAKDELEEEQKLADAAHKLYCESAIAAYEHAAAYEQFTSNGRTEAYAKMGEARDAYHLAVSKVARLAFRVKRESKLSVK